MTKIMDKLVKKYATDSWTKIKKETIGSLTFFFPSRIWKSYLIQGSKHWLDLSRMVIAETIPRPNIRFSKCNRKSVNTAES